MSAPITAVAPVQEGLFVDQSQAFRWATGEQRPLWPGWEWLQVIQTSGGLRWQKPGH
jgi:hypothetical protein